MRGSTGTAGSIIGSGGFPEGEIRRMLSTSLGRKSTTDCERTFLNQVRTKNKLNQSDRKEIRRINLKGRRRR